MFQRPPSWISSIVNHPEEKAKVEAPKESSQSFLEPDQQQQREKNTFGLEDDQLGEETTRRDILTVQEEENPTDHELEKDVENEANLLPGHTHREQGEHPVEDAEKDI